jgi:uncharacterized protein YjiS (DUF1127 family)
MASPPTSGACGVPFRSSVAPLVVLGAHAAAAALRRLAQRIERRFSERRRATDSRCVLDALSERELRDIGLMRSDLAWYSYGSVVQRGDPARCARAFFLCA